MAQDGQSDLLDGSVGSNSAAANLDFLMAAGGLQ